MITRRRRASPRGSTAYRSTLADAGLVDFDEQIYRAIEILITDPDARAAAQARCRLLLVDEFQDLNPAHMLLIRLLSSPAYNCFGVGDDDQVIYGYSGATPEFLIHFATYFPGAGHHALEVNYRCPQAIITAATHLVSYTASGWRRRSVLPTTEATCRRSRRERRTVLRHSGCSVTGGHPGRARRWSW